MATTQPITTWKSPAKINHFLHITGKRQDGYHNIQTLFQFLELHDTLTFEQTDENKIIVTPKIENTTPEQNLIYKAAHLLKTQTNNTQGIKIHCNKKIPIGGGLGGGSSNAATTLKALNQIWNLNKTKKQLIELGKKLGADVPIFIHGHAAWAEGTGDILYDATPEENWILLIVPQTKVTTATIFNDPNLTRNHPTTELPPQKEPEKTNDCEKIVRNHYPEIDQIMTWLNKHNKAYLTGTGSCIFTPLKNKQQGQQIQKQIPKTWQSILTKTKNNVHIEASLNHAEIDP